MKQTPIEILRAVEEWWLREGMHAFGGAPACIFMVRQAVAEHGQTHTIAHDGFTGTVVGHYVTREGKRGVVLQQVGTRVVHVYGEKWLTSPSSKPGEQ